MNDLHLSAFAPRWRFLYAARFDAYDLENPDGYEELRLSIDMYLGMYS